MLDVMCGSSGWATNYYGVGEMINRPSILLRLMTLGSFLDIFFNEHNSGQLIIIVTCEHMMK